MNRSILIVICDFLLLSLLTFSTDLNHMADENTQTPTKVVVATNAVVNMGTVSRRRDEEAGPGRRRTPGSCAIAAATPAQARNAASQQQAQLNERATLETCPNCNRPSASAQTNIGNLTASCRRVPAQTEATQQKLASAQTAAATAGGPRRSPAPANRPAEQKQRFDAHGKTATGPATSAR